MNRNLSNNSVRNRKKQSTSSASDRNSSISGIGSRQDAGKGPKLSRDVLKKILNNISEGVAVANAEGKLVMFNLAADQLTGIGKLQKNVHLTTLNREKFLDQIYLADQITPYPVEELPLARTLRGEKMKDDLEFLRSPSRPEGVLLSVSGQPLLNEKGKVQGGIVIFRDVTFEKQIEQNLKVAKQAAEVAERAKSCLLEAMSHDVRNPMAGLVEMLDIVLKTDLTPAQREYASSMRNLAENLVSVIASMSQKFETESRETMLNVDLIDSITSTDEIEESKLYKEKANKPQPHHFKTFNYEKALERLGGDQNFLRKISKMFATEEWPQFKVQIEGAFQAANPAMLRAAVHSLKGSLANFYPNDVMNTVQELHERVRNGEIERAKETFAVVVVQMGTLVSELELI